MAESTSSKSRATRAADAPTEAEEKPAEAAPAPEVPAAVVEGKPADAPEEKPAGVPAGHRRVRWLFNPRQNVLVGSVVDMPVDEAQTLAAANRVAYVDESTPLGKAAPEGEQFRVPAAGRDTGSVTATTPR
ncbi:hypothetical protein AB0O64_37790 [Streptomyces sp. NPDC088341]|uniref:hypothetical protein n=1 Tax=Streptomyces sp. NPDC088341 TaxID=3154870 RepID=UPI0034306FAA